MKITYNQYDRLCEDLQQIKNSKPGWYPSKADILKIVSQNPEKYINFMLWIMETAGSPLTKEMAEGKKTINQILIKSIELIDDNE